MSCSSFFSSLALVKSSDEAEHPFPSNFETETCMGVVLQWRGSRLKCQQQAALRDAFVDLFEKPWIAVLMLEAGLFACAAFAFGQRSRLDGALRPLPGGPGFGFDEGQLLELLPAGLVEIANRRLAPLLPDRTEIAGHRGLRHAQQGADRFLRQSFEGALRHLPATIGHSILATTVHESSKKGFLDPKLRLGS